MPVDRRRLVVAVIASVTGLAILFTVQMTVNRQRIEDRLRADAEATLRTAGLDDVHVSVVGRDVTASARADSVSELNRAHESLRDHPGIRSLDTVMAIGSASGDDRTGATGTQAVVTIADGRIAMSGRVPNDRARRLLIAAATGVVGRDRVSQVLRVDRRASTRSVAALTAVVEVLDPAASGSVEVAGGTISLHGTVPRRDARDAAVEAAARVLRDPSRIVDGLVIEEDAVTPVGLALEEALAEVPEIGFAAGGAVLNWSDRQAVAEAAEILLATPGPQVRIEGHTDASGSEESNLRLSRERAEAVREALIDEGVPASRLTAVGYGESRPREEGEGPDRRVVFEVVP